MYSVLYTNNSRKLVDNERGLQRNDTVTNRQTAFYEDDEQPINDMNFTLFSTLQATGATTAAMSSDNISISTENYKDFRINKDIGNVSRALSKVSKSNIIARLSYFHTRNFVPQIIFGITSKAATNITRPKQEDEEINQFYFYEVSLIR